MLKGIKWPLVIIVMSVSLVLLFAGWYLYQENNIKDPIVNGINDIQGVKVDGIILNTKEIELNLTFKHIDNLQITYNDIVNILKPYIKNREMTINIKSNPSDKIIKAWNNSYFYIAEAIKQNQYSLIPESIEKLKRDYLLDQANCTMDEKNIYINLQDGNSFLYIVLETNESMEANTVG